MASTVILSALVSTGVGWVLLQQTREGLLDQRVRAVVAEASAESAAARTRLQSVPGTDVDAASQRRELVDPILERGRVRGFDIVLAAPGVGDGAGLPLQTYSTPGLDLDESLPAPLVQHFATSGATAWTYTTISRRGQPEAPGVIVGSRVRLPADSGGYTLYYLFPLQDEQETLALVTRAMLTAGLLLLVLVAGLTWLVTRQVVTPIRMARRVAERLAAGQLQERLRVRGEDDLARLATSFNQMAANLQRQIRQLEELSRVQRRFVSDVSHELRTPLTTVRMASDVLHDARDRLRPRHGASCRAAADRARPLRARCSPTCWRSAASTRAPRSWTPRTSTSSTWHREWSPRLGCWPTSGGCGSLVEAPPEPCLAEADVRRVERIVRNLVTNAIDHAESA